MQLVILAGGLGTRLGPLTANTPKSLVPVLGRPFLEHQIKLVLRAGVKRLVLCIGHYGEQIVEHFGDGSAYGVEIVYSREGEQLLGTGGALKQAEGLLDDAFMMMWGDSYLLLDYADIWRNFQAQDLPAMMVVFRNQNQRVASNVVVDGGRVTVYDKWSPDPDKVFIDEGLTCLNKQLLDRVPVDEPFAIEQVFRDLAGEGNLAAYETPQPFYEIGSPEGITELETILRGQESGA
jgi:N-acetyl-alpha-D-muramate 1-phosphate uridylyltransferase